MLTTTPHVSSMPRFREVVEPNTNWGTAGGGDDK
jgi:hypothetical protein